MNITLCVTVAGQNPSVSMCTNLDEVQRRCFAPLKTSDDRLIGALAGDVSDVEARIIIKTRKDAAQIIAKELAEMIVNEMKKNDTHDGYEI